MQTKVRSIIKFSIARAIIRHYSTCGLEPDCDETEKLERDDLAIMNINCDSLGYKSESSAQSLRFRKV